MYSSYKTELICE